MTRRFDMTWYYVTLALILVLVFSPFILVLAATALAEANTMGRIGGLMMPAVPLGLLALAIWLVVLIVNGVHWSRRQGGA